MGTNREHDDVNDYDLDSVDEDSDIDPFLDAMELQDSKRAKVKSPRRAIEALQEKKRLKELLEDYPECD